MSNIMYNRLWDSAMDSLHEQLKIEDNSADLKPGEQPVPPPTATIFETYQHFACLYIKYIKILKNLDLTYDNITHPQKRADIKITMQLVIAHIIELRRDLVKWNPVPPDLKMITNGIEEGFPWEYTNFDDILVDLKLSPDDLAIKTPNYFSEDSLNKTRPRDRLIMGYTRLKLSRDKNLLPEASQEPYKPVPSMSIAQAIEIAQRHERGRQGVRRMLAMKRLANSQTTNKISVIGSPSVVAGLSSMAAGSRKISMFAAVSETEMEPEVAATHLQRVIRGYVARSIANRERDDELVFLGMRRGRDACKNIKKEAKSAYSRRKEEQAESKAIYDNSVIDMKGFMKDEEGPHIREAMREERIKWVTDQVAQDKFPDNLDEFYASKVVAVSSDGAEDAGDKGAKPDKKKKGEKDKKDKKSDKKTKGDNGDESTGPELPPPLQRTTALSKSIGEVVNHYEDAWKESDPTSSLRYDENMLKDGIRDEVVSSIRQQVDEVLLLNLTKIKLQVGTIDGKGKKKKKGKGKKSKKSKKGKGKLLPGEKISELKNMDVDQMLSNLIEEGIVVSPRNVRFDDIWGEFNYLGSMCHNAEKTSKAWQPSNPSIHQIKEAVMNYCVLPNGDEVVRERSSDAVLPKSVLFYGPPGTGKTMMVEAIANELNAILIHLSPDKVRGKFLGKNGPLKLIHMAFMVAKHLPMSPVIIYIDGCEEFFVSTKKIKSDKDGCPRFAKDLATYKNQAIKKGDRVVIIGNTSKPDRAETKELNKFFEKKIYFPFPDYASRRTVWVNGMQSKLMAYENAINKMLAKSKLMSRVDRTVAKAIKAKQTSDAELKSGESKILKQDDDDGDSNAVSLDLQGHIDKIMLSIDFSTLALTSEGFSGRGILKSIDVVITERRIETLHQRPILVTDFLSVLAHMQEVSYAEDLIIYSEFNSDLSGLSSRRMKMTAALEGDDDGKKPDAKKKK